MANRPISFEQAKREFINRFTMEHVPLWAKQVRKDGTFYAPQYATDFEWYNKTAFVGECELSSRSTCYSHSPSWPMGMALNAPYSKR